MTSLMRIRSREALAQGRTAERSQSWVPLGSISKHLQHAVLVAEDDAFYDHPGYDEKQIRIAFRDAWDDAKHAWAKGKKELPDLRGASTITQQLAKNLYLSPTRSPVRKLKELILATRLEEALDKSRILELYLNVIEWGDGIYGAEAAARAYFGRPAANLSPAEAALLAAIIPNPRARDPRGKPSTAVTRRARRILRLMRRRGYLSAAEVSAALAQPAATRPKPTKGERRGGSDGTRGNR